MRVKFCVVFVPLDAVNTKLNVPVAVGVPCKTPVPPLNVTPDGSVPEVRERVGAGTPVAVTVKLFAAAVENVVALALVNTGALFRVRVKLAVIGDSPGTVVAPQVPSASTATVDTELRLIT